ncbi:MAG TPA: hypothetical protein VIE15_00810 [Acidimicrobiales bacterium]
MHGEPEAHAVDAPNRPKLDPDAAHLDTAAAYASQVERRRRHDRDWAIERMQPRARVDTATVVVITVVVIVLVAIAVAGYLIQHGRGSAPTTTTTTTTTTTHRATTTSSRALIPAGSRSQALQSARRIDPTASATRRETVAFVWSSGNSGVQSTTATPLSASSSTSTIRTVALADAAAHELD